MTSQSVNLVALLPALIVAATALVVLVADLFWASNQRWLAVPISLVGVVAALVSALSLSGTTRSTFCLSPGACSYVEDRFAVAFQVIVLASTAVVLLLGRHELADSRLPAGEYHFLLLASVVGALTMASSRDLLSLLVSLEVVSLPAFVLVGLRRDDARSAEAALKFFLISVIATAVTLMGMSLIYGVTGSLQLNQIGLALAHPVTRQPVTSAAIMLTLAGFGFKVAAVPFHAWVPDTYQGAPVPVAAFLSVVSKTAGFAGLSLLLFVAFRPYADVWGPVLAVLAILTMTVGNLAALRQRNAVRLLAWSSVAQAGYILVPLGVAATQRGRSVSLAEAESALIAYLAIYAAMNLGAFACVIAVGRRSPGQLLSDYRGLATRQPLLAVTLAFFLACLAGLPPGVAGLFAKLAVFRVVVDGHVPWLAAIMAVNTVIALYYYALWAFSLFGSPEQEPAVARTVPVYVSAAIAIVATVTIVLSIDPEWVLHAADLAAGAH